MIKISNVVYLFQNTIKSKESTLQFFLSWLPPEQIEKINGIKDASNKANSILVRILLIYALNINSTYPDIMPLPKFSYNKHGKPFFIGFDLEFNFSHCSRGAICGVSKKPIGVDIQDTRPVSERVVKKVCTPSEQQRIFDSDNQELEFARIWSIKECVLKEQGLSIARDLKKINSEDNEKVQSFLFNDFVVSVCCDDKHTSIKTITNSDLNLLAMRITKYNRR